VRVLGAPRLLAAVEARRLRHVLLAELVPDPAARLSYRLRRDARGVRPHVRDEADLTAVAERLPLVEPLRVGHRLACGEAKALRCFLLERRRGERGGRVLPPLAPLHVRHLEGHRGDVPHHPAGGLLGLERERLAVDLVEPGVEGLLVLEQVRRDGPVLLLHEGADLVLALANEPERHRLNAASREAGSDRLPEEGAHLVAHEPVQDAASLLRLDLPRVERSGGLERLLHGPLGDLAERDALEAVAVHGVAQLLRDVVRDRLALAVRVGRQDHGVRLLGLLLEVRDDLPLPSDGHVLGLEAVLDVDPELLGGQITDVPDRGGDLVAAAQVLADRARLRGRLHDHEMAS
jgi:hypothetical protein